MDLAEGHMNIFFINNKFIKQTKIFNSSSQKFIYRVKKEFKINSGIFKWLIFICWNFEDNINIIIFKQYYIRRLDYELNKISYAKYY